MVPTRPVTGPGPWPLSGRGPTRTRNPADPGEAADPSPDAEAFERPEGTGRDFRREVAAREGGGVSPTPRSSLFSQKERTSFDAHTLRGQGPIKIERRPLLRGGRAAEKTKAGPPDPPPRPAHLRGGGSTRADLPPEHVRPRPSPSPSPAGGGRGGRARGGRGCGVESEASRYRPGARTRGEDEDEDEPLEDRRRPRVHSRSRPETPTCTSALAGSGLGR